jgi:hypothetical protein
MSTEATIMPDSHIPNDQSASAIDDTPGSPIAEHRRSQAKDRATSNEWDASKVPPSQFQKRKGSIYATPGSRDGHVEANKRESKESTKWGFGWFKSDKKADK